MTKLVCGNHLKSFVQVCNPYIDSDGNVFLNILHNDWKPVITISQVVDGIYRLFTATFTSDETTMIDLTMVRTIIEQNQF